MFDGDLPWAEPPPRGVVSARATVLWTLLLGACWVQFSAAWLYPRAPEFDEGLAAMINSKPNAVPFQYTLWLLIVAATVKSVRRHGWMVARGLAPFVPYGLALMVSALYGYDLPYGVRSIVLWVVSLVSAGVIANELPGARAGTGVVLAAGAVIVASMMYSLALPDLGSMSDPTGRVWRGLFTDKNQFGWLACLAAVVAWTLRGQVASVYVWVTLPTAALCLVRSDSKGGLVSAMLAVGYISVLPWLRRRTTVRLALLALAFGVVVLAVAGLVLAPMLAQALGRDLTLTGRTLVWQSYLADMLRSPWIGSGPTAFTNMSPYTLKLAYRLQSVGTILTPHNFFLGVFGDTGLVGLVSVVGLLGYFSVLCPLRHDDPYALAVAGVGMASVLEGLVETHDATVGGPTWFLLAFFWAASRRWRRDAAARKSASSGPWGALSEASTLPFTESGWVLDTTQPQTLPRGRGRGADAARDAARAAARDVDHGVGRDVGRDVGHDAVHDAVHDARQVRWR